MVIRNELRRNSRDDDNRSKDIFVKTLVMLLLSFIVFVFAAVAWFAMNKDTGASGMGVKPADDQFYLRVAENSSEDYRDAYDDLFDLADISYTLGESETVSGTKYYKTTGGNPSIRWTLEDADIASGSNIYADGLNPGTSGTLRFEIVPLIDGNLSIDFDFNIRGFVCEYDNEGHIDSLNEVTETSSAASATEKSALKYINGHIIYFTGNVNDKYTGYIENGVYHWSTTSAVKNTAIPVTIHWVWINTIDQVILKSGDGGNEPLIADTSTDRSLLIDYLKANKANVFDNLSDDLTNLSYETFKNNTTLSNHMEDKYNAADQIIGTSLHYILFDMTADLARPASTPTPTPAA